MRAKLFALLFSIGALAALFNSCGRKFSVVPRAATPQPQKVPSVVPQKVGINTDGGWSDSPFISRDGRRLYFMYSRYNFANWIKSGGEEMPTPDGPDRPGLNKSDVNPWDESDTYVATRLPDGTWSEPVALGFNGPYGDACGMEIQGGKRFVWLKGNGSTNDIVMAERLSDGSWGSPIDLGVEINDHTLGALQDNPHMTEDGRGLFFVSTREGGSGGKDLWFSLNPSGRLDGEWTKPISLGAIFNSIGDDDQLWIHAVTQQIFWNTADGLKTCVSNGSSCNESPTPVVIPGCDIAAEVSMPDDGRSIYFGCGNAQTGQVKIMFSIKQPDGSWGQATPVD